MTRREKLELLNDLVIDEAIKQLESGEVNLKDLNSIITLLKNNKVVEEKQEHDEAEVIDNLIKDKK